VFVVAKLTKK